MIGIMTDTKGVRLSFKISPIQAGYHIWLSVDYSIRKIYILIYIQMEHTQTNTRNII